MRLLLSFLWIIFVVKVRTENVLDANGELDYFTYFDDDMEPEGGSENWPELDDEIEAREEEYYRRRRQILINRFPEREKFAPTSEALSDCPEKCTCRSREEVHCTFKFLAKVPDGMPEGVEKINLGYNKLELLPGRTFEKHSASLQFLFLHSNDIRSLNNAVFSKLENIQVLRLSWNKLTGIRKIALHGLHRVERLYLDNNRLSFIHPLAFRGLVNLKLLQLDGNRLSKLHEDLFVTLEFQKYFKFSSIQYLYLSKNSFQNLPQRLFDNMQSLKRAYLHANSWDCSCELKWLKKWMDEKQKYRCKRNSWNPRKPEECAACAWPPRLEGIRLQDISYYNMTCEAPSLTVRIGPEPAIRYIMDLEEISRQDENAFFGHSGFFSTRMKIRLDSQRRSVFHASCNLTRVPNVRVEEVFESGENEQATGSPTSDPSTSRTHTGYFDSRMRCEVEYPEDFPSLQTVLGPYLDRTMNLTLRVTKPSHIGKSQAEYSVSVPDVEGSPQTPVTGASISSASEFIRSPSSAVTFNSESINEKEKTIDLAFQTSFTHTHVPKIGKYSKQRWTLIKKTQATGMGIVIAIERRTASLKCRAIGQPKPKKSWVLPWDEVLGPGNTSGRYSVTKSGRLFIRKAKPDDSGVYRCIASVPDTADSESTAQPSSADAELNTVKVDVFPRTIDSEGILSQLHIQTVDEGDKWTSDCNVQGVPNMTVAWITPSNQLIVSGAKGRHARVSMTKTGKVIVKNFEKSDQGIYRCVTSNILGTSEFSAYVGMRSTDNELIETIEIPRQVSHPDETLEYDDDEDLFLPPILPEVTTRATRHTTTTTEVALLPIIPEVTKEATPERTTTTTRTSRSTSSRPQKLHPTESKTQVPIQVKTDTDPATTGRSPVVTKKATQTTEITNLTPAPKGSEVADVLDEVLPIKPPMVSPSTISPGTESKRVEPDNVSVPDSNVITLTVEDMGLPTENPTFDAHEDPTDGRETPEQERDSQPQTRFTSAPVNGPHEEVDEILPASTLTVPELIWEDDLLQAGTDSPDVSKEMDEFDTDVEGTAPGTADVPLSAPVILEFPQNPITVKLGGTVTIPCNAEGSPMLSWKRRGDSRPISSVPRAPVFDTIDVPSVVFVNKPAHMDGHLALIINGATASDDGVYTCTATNAAGVTTKDVKVIVGIRETEQERIELAISDIKVECGGKATIPCALVPKFPASLVLWTVPGGSTLPVSSARENGITVFRNATLFLSRVTSEHSGTYQCEIKKPVGTAFMVVKVTVDCSPPHIVEPTQSNIVVDYGADVGVTCRATGSPTPTVTWVSTANSGNGRGFLQLRQVIANTTRTCVASNKVGNATFELHVSVRASRPHIDSGLPASVSSLRGLAIRLDCIADGTPKPSYVWYHPDGSIISNAESEVIMQKPNGSLVIKHVTESLEGEYRCIAGNQLGTDEMTVALIVTQPYVPVSRTDTFPDPKPKPSDEFDIIPVDEPRNVPKHGTQQPPEVPSPKYDTNFTNTPTAHSRKPVMVEVQVRPRVTFPSYLQSPQLIPLGKDPETTQPLKITNGIPAPTKERKLIEPIPTVQRTLIDPLPTNQRKPTIVGPTKHHKLNLLQHLTPTRRHSIPPTGVTMSRLPTSSTRGTMQSKFKVEMPARRIYHTRTTVYRPAGRLGRNDMPFDLDSTSNYIFRPTHRTRRVYHHSQRTIRALHGKQVVLPCVKFEPRPTTWSASTDPMTYEWTLPSGATYGHPHSPMPTNPRYLMHGNGSLVIRSPNSKDAGLYTCTASRRNENTEYQTTISLRVESEHPHIAERMQDFIMPEARRPAWVPCTTRGHPAPVVTWTTPNGNTIGIGSWSSGMTVLRNGTLYITAIRPESSGRYICKATNNAGQRRRTVQLHVTSYPPRIRQGIQSQQRSVPLGGNIQIPCEATGSPPPTFTWVLANREKVVRNQAIFRGRLRTPKFAVLSSGTLVINRAELNDAGTYLCTAENSHGRDIAWVTLRVYE